MTEHVERRNGGVKCKAKSFCVWGEGLTTGNFVENLRVDQSLRTSTRVIIVMKAGGQNPTRPSRPIIDAWRRATETSGVREVWACESFLLRPGGGKCAANINTFRIQRCFVKNTLVYVRSGTKTLNHQIYVWVGYLRFGWRGHWSGTVNEVDHSENGSELTEGLRANAWK